MPQRRAEEQSKAQRIEEMVFTFAHDSGGKGYRELRLLFAYCMNSFHKFPSLCVAKAVFLRQVPKRRLSKGQELSEPIGHFYIAPTLVGIPLQNHLIQCRVIASHCS